MSQHLEFNLTVEGRRLRGHFECAEGRVLLRKLFFAAQLTRVRLVLAGSSGFRFHAAAGVGESYRGKSGHPGLGLVLFIELLKRVVVGRRDENKKRLLPFGAHRESDQDEPGAANEGAAGCARSIVRAGLAADDRLPDAAMASR